MARDEAELLELIPFESYQGRLNEAQQVGRLTAVLAARDCGADVEAIRDLAHDPATHSGDEGVAQGFEEGKLEALRHFEDGELGPEGAAGAVERLAARLMDDRGDLRDWVLGSRKRSGEALARASKNGRAARSVSS